MDWLVPAVANVFALSNLLWLFLAIAGGILVGALPGLTGTMAIALMVPFTYHLTPETALIVLGGIYVGAMYGGSISAILINTPGVPASIATTFDGYPMARKGQAEEALCAAATSSGIGGVLGTVVLLFFAPALAVIALKFGPPEYFWLGIMGLAIIANLSSRNIFKGLFGGLVGVLLSTIGLSPTTGEARLTFDTAQLLSGVEVIVALIGLFCLPQVIIMAEGAHRQDGVIHFKAEPGRTLRAFFVVLRSWGNLLRSSVIGTVVGIIPGAGGNVAGLLAYQEAARVGRDKESFGKGNIQGVIASETSNNAAVEGSLVPLLTLGIPGSPQAAVLYGALLLHGLRPGAELFTGHGAVVTYTFIFSFFLGNLIMFGIGISASRLYARALNLPNNLLMPVVLALSVVGAYAGRNNSFDVGLMLALGLLAYGGLKIGLSAAPIALGIILGPIAERGLVESMMLARATGGLLELLFTRPLSLVLIALTLVSVFWSFILKVWRHWRGGQPATPETLAAKVSKARAGGQVAGYLWLGIPGIVVAGVALRELVGVDGQTAVVPAVTSGLIGLVSAGFLVKAAQIRWREGPSPAAERRGNERGLAVLAILAAVGYAILIPILGFYAVSFAAILFLGCVLAAPDQRRRRLAQIVTTAVVVCGAFYVVFGMVFHVPFPTGILF